MSSPLDPDHYDYEDWQNIPGMEGISEEIMKFLQSHGSGIEYFEIRMIGHDPVKPPEKPVEDRIGPILKKVCPNISIVESRALYSDLEDFLDLAVAARKEQNEE